MANRVLAQRVELTNDKIVYMKVRDSVLLNLIDSTNFPTSLPLKE